MSMFYLVKCSGRYDKKDRTSGWSDGITDFEEPVHMTRAEILEAFNGAAFPVILDKSVCPLVQEVERSDKDGVTRLTLIVKASGYGQADERARNFCAEWWKPRPVSKKNRVKAKELLNSIPKGIRQASLFGHYDFEYIGKGYI